MNYSKLKKYLTIKYSRQGHLKYYPFFSIMVLAPYLKIFDEATTVNSLKGKKLMAALDLDNTNDDYIQKYIEMNLPALLYNILYYDVVSHPESSRVIDDLEQALARLSEEKNPWCSLFIEAFYNDSKIDGQYLLGLEEERQMELTLMRKDFENMVEPIYSKARAMFYLNKADLVEWLREASINK